MGNFIAKRWTYIEDDKVWVHRAPDVHTGPDYVNPTFPLTDARSDTEFSYLSADGDDTQAFVNALP